MRLNHIPHQLQSLTFVVKVSTVLKALKTNRARHVKVLKEAQDGYRVKAEEQLKARLKKIQNGQNVDLAFNLPLPRDFTGSYDLAIQMMEANTKKTIDLDAQQYQMLVADRWEWSSEFYLTNASYSSTAAAIGASH